MHIHKPAKTKKYTVISVAAALAFVVFGTTVPVSINAEPSSAVYAGEAAGKDDVNVYETTLFGVKKANQSYVVAEDTAAGRGKASMDKAKVKVSSGILNATTSIPIIQVSKVAAEYDGIVYEGETPDKSHVTVSYIYEDGTEQPADGYNITFDAPITGDTNYDISTDYGTAVLHISPVKAASLSAVYDGTAYAGEPLDTALVTAEAEYEDGTKKMVEAAADYDSTEPIYGDTDVSVHTVLGDTSAHISVQQPDEIRASYTGSSSVYEGKHLDDALVSAEYVFADGHTTKASSVTVPDTGIGPDGAFTAETPLGEASGTVDVVKISGVTANIPDNIYAGDTFSPDSITVTYEDGTSEEIDVSDCAPITLYEGDNACRFEHDGYTYTVGLQPKNLTAPVIARRQNTDEQERAVYKITDDSLYAVVTEHDEETEGAHYLLTHIIVDNPTGQVKAGLSYDDYGGDRETVSSFAKRKGAAIAVNGSFFSYGSGGLDMQTLGAVVKASRAITGNDVLSDGREICLYYDGMLRPAEPGLTAQELVDLGVTDTFGSGNPACIKDGEDVNLDSGMENKITPKTVIGMVAPGEYYIITAGSSGYKGGMSNHLARQIMKGLSCTFAQALDGGGSSEIVFNGDIINNPATGKERPVADFLYFVENKE